MFLLTGCYNYNELNDLGIIFAIYVDYQEGDYIVELELSILNAMQYKMELENTSSKILLNLKSLRYFKFLKLDEKIYIKDIKKLNRKIKIIEKMLVTKLCEMGTLQMLSYDIDINYDLISAVLETQILDLEIGRA